MSALGLFGRQFLFLFLVFFLFLLVFLGSVLIVVVKFVEAFFLVGGVILLFVFSLWGILPLKKKGVPLRPFLKLEL